MLIHQLVPWPPGDIRIKFYGDRPRGTPPSGELNTRGVAEYSEFLDLSNAISRKRFNIGAKLVLITNRKSHISFRLVPNSVTLDDLEFKRDKIQHNNLTHVLNIFYVWIAFLCHHIYGTSYILLKMVRFWPTRYLLC